jgi:methylisocitrate lyase
VEKLRAAVAARQTPDFFIIGRTDAIAPNGLDDALRRGEAFVKAGVDGVYLEGARTRAELKRIGRTFEGVPLAISLLEGGGKTPILSPPELHTMGFTMLLYPTSVLFRLVRETERALTDLRDGKPMSPGQGCSLEEFEDLVDIKRWKSIETNYPAK